MSSIQEIYDKTIKEDPFYFIREYMTEEAINKCKNCKLKCKDTMFQDCELYKMNGGI